MTNIIEIVALLQKDGYNLDIIIIDGTIILCYKQTQIDITTMSFADQIRHVCDIINKEIFG